MLVEKVSRFAKHAMRNMPVIFRQVVPQYMEVVYTAFEKKPFSTSVRVGSWRKYADQTLKEPFAQLFEALATKGHAVLAASQDKSPELIEDFYGMLAGINNSCGKTIFKI